jgi:penicillin-binding protein 1A
MKFLSAIGGFIKNFFTLLWRVKRKILKYCAVVSLVGVLVLAVLYFIFVVQLPGEHMQQENILRSISMESPIFYSDGTTRLGAFFEKAHRQYVRFDQAPQLFIEALIAAEDAHYYQHPGINPLSIARAMMANLAHMRVVQGGSTLTQQTAKNIFQRKDRSLSEKWRELVNALRLEYHYGKDKILEFYLNQFYVSGNGRGLGIAARYYFNKPVGKLDLIECAFIAGSVKIPERYNPFTKSGPEKAVEARAKARRRVGYVLRRMHEERFIDDATYAKAATAEVVFNKGQFRYRQSTVLDRVAEMLNRQEFQMLLAAHGIENLATSGITVITTLDPDIAPRAEYEVRHNLSRLDARLRGYAPPPTDTVFFRAGAELKQYGFYRGKIIKILSDGKKSKVQVDFGLNQGTVDFAGLRNITDQVKSHKKGGYPYSGAVQVEAFLADLKVGDSVLVSLREFDEKGRARLDLEQYAEVEGGLIVLEQEQIRALVGGFENSGYDRATVARRQPGSVFKIPLYLAAMQLGWLPTDRLPNARSVFPYQRSLYFPRPDHNPATDEVSIAWAGANSENLASIWLLYHLCDRLTAEQFRALTVGLGIGRREGEDSKSFIVRVRDRYGILPDRESVKEILFEEVRADLRAELIFDGKQQELSELQNLLYGRGFGTEIQSLRTKLAGQPSYERATEDELRLGILRHSYLRYEGLARQFENRLKLLQVKYGEFDVEQADDWTELNGLLAGLHYPAGVSGEVSLAWWPTGSPVGWEPFTPEELLARIEEQGEQVIEDGNVLIEGKISLGTIEAARKGIRKRKNKLGSLAPYAEESLYYNRDYRVAVAIAYVVELCRQLGIESDLDPVLSLPLGANSITLAEAAVAYSRIASGIKADFGQLQQTPALIAKILDAEGNVIYEYIPEEQKLFAQEIAELTAQIARQVVLRGTGRSARRKVRLRSDDQKTDTELARLDLEFPVFGKTGTTNNYRNATFVGFLPTPGTGDSLSLAGNFAIASYVGYDDNRPLVSERRTVKLAGASAALPPWAATAQAIVRARPYSKKLDLADMIFRGISVVPVEAAAGMAAVTVDPSNGLGIGSPVALSGVMPGEDELMLYLKKGTPYRFFTPLVVGADWLNRIDFKEDEIEKD